MIPRIFPLTRDDWVEAILIYRDELNQIRAILDENPVKGKQMLTNFIKNLK